MITHLIISEKEKSIRIPCATILYLQADGHYTHIFLKAKKKHCSTKTLGVLERQLNPAYFIRTHGKFVVNIAEVVEYEKARGGNAVLTDGSRISVSYRKKQNFLKLFNMRA